MGEQADDEPGEAGTDNSVGRFLALSDGVFAIAMTLLALDLKVPDLGDHVADGAVRHALGHEWPNVLSYLLSFYVVGLYWLRHHALMRTLTRTNHRLLRDNIVFLLFTSALPFPASLMGQYGTSDPIALAIYAGVSAAATLMLLVLQHDVRSHRLAPAEDDLSFRRSRADSVGNLLVFLICMPAGYVLGAHHGPYALLLLFPAGVVTRHRYRARR